MHALGASHYKLPAKKSFYPNASVPPFGFTLIELLATLFVLSILLVIAIPSFRAMLLNNRINTQVDSLIGGLNYARALALNNNSTTRVCPFSSPNSTTCGVNWALGWIVITQPASGSAVLLKSEQYSLAGPAINANNNTVTFNPRGLAANQTNFSLCDARGSRFARSVGVMATGYIQSGDTPGRAVWNNLALSCP